MVRYQLCHGQQRGKSKYYKKSRISDNLYVFIDTYITRVSDRADELDCFGKGTFVGSSTSTSSSSDVRELSGEDRGIGNASETIGNKASYRADAGASGKPPPCISSGLYLIMPKSI